LNSRASKRPIIVKCDNGKTYSYPRNSIIHHMSKGPYERTNDSTGDIEVFGV
jgi:hypothetical protein